MRILVVGGTGTIGRAIVAALRSHELTVVGRRSSPVRVDIQDEASIAAMYESVGGVDAVVSAAGDVSFAPLSRLTGEDFSFSLGNMLMGQVNLVRLGTPFVRDRGSFTLTAGSLSRWPMPGGAVISLVTSALEGFTRAAALEMPRGIRINTVSPPWISETLSARGKDPSQGVSAEQAARSYLASVLGSDTGTVIDP